MRLTALLLAACGLAACSVSGVRQADPEAVRDFISANELQPVDEIRTSQGDGHTVLNDYFVIYNTRKAHYLVEFKRKCFDIDDPTQITPDNRSDPNRIRPRFDSIRGCFIDTIYALNDAQDIELRNLGAAPGNETNR